MKITDFLPSPMLRPFIKCYRVVEGKEEITNRVLPGTSLAIAFRLAGQVSYASGADAGILPPITFSGLRKSARLIHYSWSASTLVVLFREGAASAFFREPLNELFEETYPLNAFIHDRALDRLEADGAVLHGFHRFTISRQRCSRIWRPSPPIMNGMSTP